MIGIFTKCEITARLSCSARSAHQWQHQHQNESPPRQHEQKKWKKEYWRMWRRRCKTLQWFCLKNVHCRATSIKVWKTFCALHHYQTIAKFIASVTWFRISDCTTISRRTRPSTKRKNFDVFDCDFYRDAFIDQNKYSARCCCAI